VPTSLEVINVESNSIDGIMNLKYIPLFGKLRVLNTGFLFSNQDLRLLSFVKHICPSLEVFDGVDCSDSLNEGSSFDDQKLVDLFLNGTESELRELLLDDSIDVKWDDPVFIAYDTDLPLTPIKNLEERIKNIESQIPSTQKAMGETVSLIPPNQDSMQTSIDSLRNEVSEIKRQISQIAELLFVHDKAVERLWNQSYDEPRN